MDELKIMTAELENCIFFRNVIRISFLNPSAALQERTPVLPQKHTVKMVRVPRDEEYEALLSKKDKPCSEGPGHHLTAAFKLE